MEPLYHYLSYTIYLHKCTQIFNHALNKFFSDIIVKIRTLSESFFFFKSITDSELSRSRHAARFSSLSGRWWRFSGKTWCRGEHSSFDILLRMVIIHKWFYFSPNLNDVKNQKYINLNWRWSLQCLYIYVNQWKINN